MNTIRDGVGLVGDEERGQRTDRERTREEEEGGELSSSSPNGFGDDRSQEGMGLNHGVPATS